MKLPRVPLSLLTLLALASLPAPLKADWTPTAGGTFSYTDTANWSGGSRNGKFSGNLTGNQIITFDQDWQLTSDTVRLLYTAPYDLTFQSDSSTAHVIKWDNTANRTYGIASNGTGKGTAMRTVIFGTASNPLIMDLGDGNYSRTIRSDENTNFLFNAKITGGHNDNWLIIQSPTTALAGFITLANNESDFISNLSITAARPLRVTSVANAGVASAIGAGDKIRFNNSSRADFEYIGAAASTNRTISLESGVVYLYNNGTGKLTFTGAFERSKETDTELRFTGTQDIEVTGSIAEKITVTKAGNATLTLRGASAFSGGLAATQGWTEFTSVADAGTESSLGANGIISVGSGAHGRLRYIGTANSSTNRGLTISRTATIANDGTGSVAFTGSIAVEGTEGINYILTLAGSNQGNNLIAGNIADATGSSHTIRKTDEGRWILSGNNTYSGGTEIAGGYLVAASDDALGSAGVVIDGAAQQSTLLINEGIHLTLPTLELKDDAHLAFQLGETFEFSTLTTESQLGSGIYTIDLFGFGQPAVGEYILLTAANWEAAGFTLGETGSLLNGSLFWNDGVLSLKVIPEPGTTALALLGLAFCACALRHRKTVNR